MKTIFNPFNIICLALFFSACGAGSDKVTGSTLLTDDLSGNYAREYKKDKGSYFNTFRDTILIVRKDQNFEVANHKWFESSDHMDEGFSKIHGFQTFQGIYNQTDTTISHPQGGSLKFDKRNRAIYMVDKPDQLYIKVK